jgi:hypothetical protein
MAKITIDTETNNVKTAREIVVEPAVGADAGGISPARAIQYNGTLVSQSNKFPVEVNFPATQATSDAALGRIDDPPASGDAVNAGLISFVKRLSSRVTFLFQGTAGNPNPNVITVQGIANGQSMLVSAPPPATVVTGQRTVTTAGTAISLGTAVGLVSGVTIKSLSANTGRVFLRAAGSTTSFELKPGESTIVFVSRLDALNIDAEVNGEGVCYHGS